MSYCKSRASPTTNIAQDDLIAAVPVCQVQVPSSIVCSVCANHEKFTVSSISCKHDVKPNGRHVVQFNMLLTNVIYFLAIAQNVHCIWDNLYQHNKGKNQLAGFEGPSCEDVGLLKLDCLAIRGLDKVMDVVKIVAGE